MKSRASYRIGPASLKFVCKIIYIFFHHKCRGRKIINIYIFYIFTIYLRLKEGEGENPGSKPSSCTGEGIDTAHQAGVSMQRQGHSAGEGGVDAARRLGASMQRVGQGH